MEYKVKEEIKKPFHGSVFLCVSRWNDIAGIRKTVDRISVARSMLSRAQIAVEDKRIRELVNRLLALGLIHNEILQR